MLESIVRKEFDIEGWQEKPELVERILVHLNHLHRDALQRALRFEAEIREAGGEPDVKVIITWPEPPPEPEPDPEPGP